MIETGEYFSGQKLYGDNFSFEKLKIWYEEEKEGYASLGAKDEATYSYVYHEMNKLFGFDYLPKNRLFENALGIGSAYGHEFLPIVNFIKYITIIEPSDALQSVKIGDITPIYLKPQISGQINFEDYTFDIILCFGTLHHIANVYYVLNEMIRILKQGGFLLIREPISTMGDWNYPRIGLTKNERGIPSNYFDKIFIDNNIKIISKSFCDVGFLYKISNCYPKFTRSRNYYKLDRLIGKTLSWNNNYHRRTLIHKLAPGSIFYIVNK